jgi:hypothetical protein
VVRGLTRPHSARMAGDRIWVANSGYGEVGPCLDGRFEPVAAFRGWTRGLCFHRSTAFVGTSRVIPRFRAYAPGLDVDRSVCGVHAVDGRSGRVLGGIVWPAGNQVFGIDWVDRRFATGLPFASGNRRSRAVRDLFYAFEVDR